MQIKIITLRGVSYFIQDVNVTDTIESIQTKITEQTNVPLYLQKLISLLNNEIIVLAKDSKISDYPAIIEGYPIFLKMNEQPTMGPNPNVISPVLKFGIHIAYENFEPLLASSSNTLRLVDDLDKALQVVRTKMELDKQHKKDRKIYILAMEVSETKLDFIEKTYGIRSYDEDIEKSTFGNAGHHIKEYVCVSEQDSHIQYNLLGYCEGIFDFVPLREAINPNNWTLFQEEIFLNQKKIIAKQIKQHKELVFDAQKRPCLTLPAILENSEFLCDRDLEELKLHFPRSIEFLEQTIQIENMNALEELYKDNRIFLQHLLFSLLFVPVQTDQDLLKRINTILDDLKKQGFKEKLSNQQKNALQIFFSYCHGVGNYAYLIKNAGIEINKNWHNACIAFLQVFLPQLDFGFFNAISFKKEVVDQIVKIENLDIKISEKPRNIDSKLPNEPNNVREFNEKTWEALSRDGKDIVYYELEGKNLQLKINPKDRWASYSLEKKETFFSSNKETFEMLKARYLINNVEEMSFNSNNFLIGIDFGGVLDDVIFKNIEYKKNSIKYYKERSQNQSLTREQREEALKEYQTALHSPFYDADKDILLPNSVSNSDTDSEMVRVIPDGYEVISLLKELINLGGILVSHSRNSFDDQSKFMTDIREAAKDKKLSMPFFKMIPVYNSSHNKSPDESVKVKKLFADYLVNVYEFGGPNNGETGKMDVRKAIRKAFPNISPSDMYFLDDGAEPGSKMCAAINEEGSKSFFINYSKSYSNDKNIYSLRSALNAIVTEKRNNKISIMERKIIHPTVDPKPILKKENKNNGNNYISQSQNFIKPSLNSNLSNSVNPNIMSVNNIKSIKDEEKNVPQINRIDKIVVRPKNSLPLFPSNGGKNNESGKTSNNDNLISKIQILDNHGDHHGKDPFFESMLNRNQNKIAPKPIDHSSNDFKHYLIQSWNELSIKEELKKGVLGEGIEFCWDDMPGLEKEAYLIACLSPNLLNHQNPSSFFNSNDQQKGKEVFNKSNQEQQIQAKEINKSVKAVAIFNDVMEEIIMDIKPEQQNELMAIMNNNEPHNHLKTFFIALFRIWANSLKTNLPDLAEKLECILEKTLGTKPRRPILAHSLFWQPNIITFYPNLDQLVQNLLLGNENKVNFGLV